MGSPSPVRNREVRPSTRSRPSTPRSTRPSPFRKFGRDVLAIALIASGVMLLLSLWLGGPSIHLGEIIDASLGWGAPVAGVALIVLGGLAAAGPAVLGQAEARAGVVIFCFGFVAFVGLWGSIQPDGAGGHGGDLGSAMAWALQSCLRPVVGSGAWYACAQVLVAAWNIVGFLMVTGQPLVFWARTIGKLFGCLSRLTRRPGDALDPYGPGVSENARTRQGRRDPGLVIPDAPSRRQSIPSLDGPVASPAGRSVLNPSSPLNALGALDSPVGGEGSGRSTMIGRVGPEDSQGSGRPSRMSSFTAALDALLPPSLRESGSDDGLADFLGDSAAGGSGAKETAGSRPVSLEDAVEDLDPGRRKKAGPSAADALDDAEAAHLAASEAKARAGEKQRKPGRDEKPGAGKNPVTKGPSGTLPLEFPDSPLPPPALLAETPPAPKKSADEARATVLTLERTLQEFKVEARVVEIAEGPTLTRYEIQLAPGILVKKILSLADNIAMALAAIDVRVEAPIPGKSAIGVEIPKRTPGVVGLREMVDTPEFRHAPRLTFALGRDVTGAPQYADLARMPHLLIAGSTGSGKSACLNTLISSLLYRAEPHELRFVMIDPKKVELSFYDGIPHLCHQIVRDSRRAPQALGKVLAEMDRRYLLLQAVRTRDIIGYNSKMDDPDRKLPYIVVVIDELADLMMTSGAETEHAITRIAQLARAVGIHLVVATQRPSVDIVTGKIKANISSRIAFAVSSGIDSRTILDCVGAERLIGRGDMLFLPMDVPKPRRIQGAYISEQELEKVVEFWRSKGSPDYYLEHMTMPESELEPTGDASDELYGEAVRVVLNAGQASTSMIQRRLKIGYNRAATLIELMEQHGVVGPQDGVRPREVLISQDQWELSQQG